MCFDKNTPTYDPNQNPQTMQHKILDLTGQVGVLKTENTQLKNTIEELKKANTRLEEMVQKLNLTVMELETALIKEKEKEEAKEKEPKQKSSNLESSG